MIPVSIQCFVICFIISQTHSVVLFLTFILKFHIWVVNNLTQGYTAHLATHAALPPATSHGTVRQAHTQFTGEVNSMAKQRILYSNSK